MRCTTAKCPAPATRTLFWGDPATVDRVNRPYCDGHARAVLRATAATVPVQVEPAFPDADVYDFASERARRRRAS